MKIKTIFFDLGGVLIHFSHELMCKNIADFCHIDTARVRREIFEKRTRFFSKPILLKRKSIGELYEQGLIDSFALYRHFADISKKPITYEGLLEAASCIFSPKEEMISIVQNLKKQHLSLYVLSNTCEAHFSYLKKQYSFLNFFDGFILSYEVKSRKPSKAIYQAAIDLAKTPLKECLYVDDIPEYVLAAKSYGIDSHLFKEANSLKIALEKRGISCCKHAD